MRQIFQAETTPSRVIPMSGENNAVTIKPVSSVQGALSLPGDKSISHRYAMLAAIAGGETKLANFSTGADCQSTLACMQALGAVVTRDGGLISIRGGTLQPAGTPLDCGNSGSTMRMLSGILAGQPFTSELIGDESLSKRPMRRVIEPLGQMGARVESNDGLAPLRITGGG